MGAAPPAVRGWRALLWVLVLTVCWLAFDPKPPAVADTGHDKLSHALAFAVLAVCAGFAHPAQPLRRLFGAGVGFGALIELVQTQVPGRSAEWGDLLADAAGAALALLLLHAWRRRRATPPA